MVRTTVKLSGFKELNQALNDLPKGAHSGALRRAGTKAMQPMADLAAKLAPDDPKTAAPDDLRTSIGLSARARAGRGGLEGIEKGTRANVHMGPSATLPRYARAVVMEFGSYKDAPQPYMRPAFEQDGQAVIDRLKPLLAAEIDKVTARLARRAARAAAKG
jgi:HK97 gp10 family phage protein